MAPQLSLISVKLNSSLKPLLPTLLWMILGLFLLLLHPLTTSSLKLKFFIMTFSRPSLTLILGRLTVRMESLLLFLKNVLPRSLTAWLKCFVCLSLLLPILLLEVWPHYLIWMSAPILQTRDKAKVNQYLQSFIPQTGKLCNFLPMSVFPPTYDLNSFKRGESTRSYAILDLQLRPLFHLLSSI